MATVTIDGRALGVWNRNEPGGLGRSKRTILAELAMREAKPQDVPDRMADLVRSYFSDDAGVDAVWLLEHLPADCSEILRQCIEASGGMAAATGEAKSP